MKSEAQFNSSSGSSSHDSLCQSSNLPASNILANNLFKSAENLLDLQELNYFPYNSCNSLTIYSYKYWQKLNKFLLTTKENNLKEISFKSSSFKPTSFVDTNEGDGNNQQRSFLEPVFKMHKFSNIKSKYNDSLNKT